jgi:HSP20 family protein
MRENDMTVMTSWDLFDDLRSAQDELARRNRMPAQWSGQFSPPSPAGTSDQAWIPAVDIYERKDAYLVAVELPGISTEDVEITFQDGLLTIQGERRAAHDPSADKVHRVERRYGPFRRSITLPSYVLADAIEASAQDGVLQVLVPKAPEAHAKRIQVRTGKAVLTSTAVKNGG